MRGLLILLFSFLPPAAQAGCEPFDLRDAMPSELKKHFSTAHTKGGMAWCFAFGAADLLSARLGKIVAPGDMALTYHRFSADPEARLPEHGYKSLEEGSNGGGSLSEAVIAAQKRGKGVCLETSFPMPGGAQLKKSTEYLEAFQELQSVRNRMRRQKDIEPVMQMQACELKIQKQFPELDAETLWKIVAQNLNNSLVDVLGKLADQNCDGKRIPLPPGIRSVERENRQANFSDVADKEMKAGNMVSFFMDGHLLRKDIPVNGEHQLVILGQKEVKGECQYVVRNSWGSDCQQYTPRFRPSCNATEGTFLLPKKDFNKVAGAIEYLTQ